MRNTTERVVTALVHEPSATALGNAIKNREEKKLALEEEEEAQSEYRDNLHHAVDYMTHRWLLRKRVISQRLSDE